MALSIRCHANLTIIAATMIVKHIGRPKTSSFLPHSHSYYDSGGMRRLG